MGLKQHLTQQALQAQKQTLDQLASIHEHIQQVLHQNEQAAQREQLPHPDLVVDVTGMGRLRALGEARVAALRESVLRAGLEQTMVWGRLKDLGWDCMEVHLTTLIGIRSSLVEVHALTDWITTFAMQSPKQAAMSIELIPNMNSIRHHLQRLTDTMTGCCCRLKHVTCWHAVWMHVQDRACFAVLV